MFLRKNLQLPELKLSYLEWNRGAEPLLLLHGLGDSGSVWQSLAEFLAEQYHMVAPDMRGHGNSGKPMAGYTFAEALADLEALMNTLNWESAHILGHSWTAKLALLWAQQQPQRFKSLIVVDPIFISKMPSILKLSFPILYRTLDCLKMMGPFPSYEAAKAQAKKLSQYRGWNELQQLVFSESIEQKPDGSWGSKFALQARDGIFEEVMRFDGLSKPIQIPTLFIQPQKGVNRTEWQLKPYKTFLKNLQIRSVPGNHWPFLVEPEVFNLTVAEFLQAQRKD
ncbi:MAG: alpha/beta hydrolase [Oscillatoriaceae bacterium SKW80]|nr:alpha/beta hydrolase [Oscillatoriaceae bacterium SKYG93]MCX8120193.1 alpha/beta hydrolase [Oscillatoriaceae bacterium SKW80]MDW8453119.1 alpha/beta hydrolase [Oscillatoriaceae cyanobacterium SKYGB_i_bin93]HIK28970.1 alpha/beta hydrolase [Oscillatoriaceae cyanobacterium M7585_C2015_266]